MEGALIEGPLIDRVNERAEPTGGLEFTLDFDNGTVSGSGTVTLFKFINYSGTDFADHECNGVLFENARTLTFTGTLDPETRRAASGTMDWSYSVSVAENCVDVFVHPTGTFSGTWTGFYDTDGTFSGTISESSTDGETTFAAE